jgi:hypothetical protein
MVSYKLSHVIKDQYRKSARTLAVINFGGHPDVNESTIIEGNDLSRTISGRCSAKEYSHERRRLAKGIVT